MRQIWMRPMRLSWGDPLTRLTLAFVALNLLDAGETWLGLRLGAEERIPLYHLLYSHYPFALGVIVKLTVVGLVCAYVLLTRHWWPRWGALLEMWPLVALMAWVVISNAVALARMG